MRWYLLQQMQEMSQYTYLTPDFPLSIEGLLSEYDHANVEEEFYRSFDSKFFFYLAGVLFGSIFIVMFNADYKWLLLAVTALLLCEAIWRVCRYSFPVNAAHFVVFLLYSVGPSLLLVTIFTIFAENFNILCIDSFDNSVLDRFSLQNHCCHSILVTDAHILLFCLETAYKTFFSMGAKACNISF